MSGATRVCSLTRPPRLFYKFREQSASGFHVCVLGLLHIPSCGMGMSCNRDVLSLVILLSCVCGISGYNSLASVSTQVTCVGT